MNDGIQVQGSSPPAAGSEAAQQGGLLFTWNTGSGDSARVHVVHVEPAGLSWLVNIGDKNVCTKLLDAINANPAETAKAIAEAKKGRRVSREELEKVTYSKSLKQLTFVDRAGKNHHIPTGNEGQQEAIYAAVGEKLRGAAGKEDVDTWSAIKNPLGGLAITLVFGALAVFLAADSEPNKEFTGRRRGMAQLLNKIGYSVGPMWMSVIVAGIAMIFVVPMIRRLMSRPTRDVLSF